MQDENRNKNLAVSPSSEEEFSSRSRTISSETNLFVRTSSDPDLSGRGRSRSYSSKGCRSRSQTKTQTSIEELLMDTELMKSRTWSVGKGPRPNPDGMASTGEVVSPEGDTSAVELSDALSNEDFDPGDSLQLHARSATEVLEKRKVLQKRREAAYLKLRAELERAHQELRKRDEECKKLSSVRDDLDKEVEDLTASLFEEAHKMVTEAKTKQASAEMQLREAKMKMDGLEAEVAALKVLVITSTPSNPGKKGHRRAPSADQICSDCHSYHCETDGRDNQWDIIETQDEKEVDRVSHREFVSWLEKHCPMSEHQFLDSIEKYDVIPCLQFPNQELSSEIFTAIKDNSLVVEAVSTSNRSRRCNLSKAPVLCSYRIRIGESDKWHFISNGCRARIIAVADLYTFLRYIKQGLIRKEVNAMYWDLMQKRGQIALARLGLIKR